MARELHKKKNQELYAIYSTIVDDYITDFVPLNELREMWLKDLIEDAKEKVDMYLSVVNKEVEE